MKTLIYSLALFLLFLVACTNGNNKTQSTTTQDTASPNAVASKSLEKGTSTAAIVNTYLKLKNALTTDSDKDAATAGNEMVNAFASFDKKTLTPAQDKLYADIYDDAKEHAEHIGANAGNIAHQREHFDVLSKDFYDLVKLLGTNKTLYVDHCPMYNNNKGAIWLSEIKDIKNPYLGKAMPTCGTVKEELK
jgi:pectate lyase